MTGHSPIQNKTEEISFFESHVPIDAFDSKTNEKIIDIFVTTCKLKSGDRVLDLGCGSGVFSAILNKRGYRCISVDLSLKQLNFGKSNCCSALFVNGDAEALPFPENAFDAILLVGLIHHFPDPSHCVQEIARVLKKGGGFFALDPNRMNPFMYLYRDKSSPFYSSAGVSENERPIIASAIKRDFEAAGLRVTTDFISGLKFKYLKSARMRRFLPWYNFVNSLIFRPLFLRWFRSLVLISGKKIK